MRYATYTPTFFFFVFITRYKIVLETVAWIGECCIFGPVTSTDDKSTVKVKRITLAEVAAEAHARLTRTETTEADTFWAEINAKLADRK